MASHRAIAGRLFSVARAKRRLDAGELIACPIDDGAGGIWPRGPTSTLKHSDGSTESIDGEGGGKRQAERGGRSSVLAARRRIPSEGGAGLGGGQFWGDRSG